MPEKPDTAMPEQYCRSYADLGIIAQRGRLIEVRTPPPNGGGPWPRIYLTLQAAKTLMEWLPKAVEQAEEREPDRAA